MGVSIVNKIATLSLAGLFSAIVVPAMAASGVEPPQACEARFDWPDDPVAHVQEASLDGSFDYNFWGIPGAAIDNVSGTYDDGAQSIEWEVTYDADHYLASTAVSGDAAVSIDGDYSATLTTTTTDVLGQVWVETVERMRMGCMERRVIDPEGLALLHSGQWTDGGYVYEEQRPLAKSRALTTLIADVSGRLHPNGLSSATAIYQQSGQEAGTTILVREQRNRDGERWIELTLDSLDAERQTNTYIAPDGTMTKDGYYGYDPRIDYGMTVDYAGVGTGWLENGDAEEYCFIEFEGSSCTRSCWDLGVIEELEEEYEDNDEEFEFEFGDYIYDVEPTVKNGCNSVLFENYAITPF